MQKDTTSGTMRENTNNKASCDSASLSNQIQYDLSGISFINNSLYNTTRLAIGCFYTHAHACTRTQIKSSSLKKKKKISNEKRKKQCLEQICTFILASGAVLICKQRQHTSNKILIDTHK